MGPVPCFGLCLLGCLLFNPTVEGARNASLALPRSPCPPGALRYKNLCYEFLDDSVGWQEAELECEYWRKDGHLASILSATEERRISSYIKRVSSTCCVWLGLQATRTPIANPTRLTWEWSDKSPYKSGSILWDGRAPSTAISNSECVALINVHSPSSTSRWAQYSCNSLFPYICKYRASV
ncbi:lithostathine-like [Sceloporus undulatus]|uniref:lithostathine-like n=1 Tax=Sceloporus undulatus TaxID=8520 RepID=UPI001C4BE85A|nr:lithostathine-like [Sceloporus undulatus]